ncbi:MAG: aromatic acid exporter family protein [Actinomycetota bacterium]|nr:aromatic acid exporter family protein [Actinomycetota bacterium]
MIRDRARAAAQRLLSMFPGVNMDADTALMLGKAVVAGTLAWLLATEVFHANNATFAAYTAMLLMHHTIAESVQKALHYTAAVLVGVVLVGVVTVPWGVHLALFPAILLVSLLVGRWYRLGSQGFNVTVTAIFAYGVVAMPQGDKSPLSLIGDLVAMVLLGAGIAVATNLLIAPPLRYRSAQSAVQTYAESLTHLIDDMASGLSEGMPEISAARDWRRRANELSTRSAQPRSTIDHAYQTSKFNPRRLLVRKNVAFAAHRVTVYTSERIAQQLVFVTAGLLQFAQAERDPERSRRTARDDFFRGYAELLSALRDAIADTATIHTLSDLHESGMLGDRIDAARSALEELSTAAATGGDLDIPSQWAFFGPLYTDAQRLCDELDSARDQFEELASHHRPDSGYPQDTTVSPPPQ